LLDRHIVQENHVRASLDGLVQFLETGNLDFNLFQVIHPFTAAPHRLTNPARGDDVILFDQNPIKKSEAMIAATSDSNRIFFQNAQTGCRLSSVQHGASSASYGFDILPCQGCNTR
jgi:hypothetical protein